MVNGSELNKTLEILSFEGKDFSGFYEIIAADSEGKLENIRIKAVVAYQLAKLCMKYRLELPNKITPILQIVVTGYKHENHPLLKQKIAKTAARITFLLKFRNCNEKFIRNLLKIDPHPIIYHLQGIHKAETPVLFDFYNDFSNPDHLSMISNYIHPSLFEYFISNFSKILSFLPNRLVSSSLVSILSQVPECIPNFVEYLTEYLKEYPLPNTEPVNILKLLLKNQIKPFIPYAACLLLPLLSHINTDYGSEVAEAFGDILIAVMLDASDSFLSKNLQNNRAECMDFLANLKGVYTLPKYSPNILLNNIELREYQKEGIA